MRPTKENGKILRDYVKLAKKLKKLPTVKESVKYITSERQLYKHFNSFENLKKLALKQLPELKPIKQVISIQKEVIYKVLGVRNEK